MDSQNKNSTLLVSLPIQKIKGVTVTLHFATKTFILCHAFCVRGIKIYRYR